MLLATGLLINNAGAGWALLLGIALRIYISRRWGAASRPPMEVIAAGFIAGDALASFFASVAATPGKR